MPKKSSEPLDASARNKSEIAKRRISHQRKDEDAWRKKTRNEHGVETSELIERAWAAGFFDGEGNVSGRQGGGVSCSIEQTISGEKKSWDKDTTGSIKGLLNLERFQRAVGVGKISFKPHRKRGQEQPTAVWQCSNQNEIQQVWGKIGMFLGLGKRGQFASVLAIPVVTALTHDKPLPKHATAVEIKPRKKH